MLALVERITREGGTTRQELRRAATVAPKPGRPRAFTFQYRPPTKAFNLQLKFKKSQVDRDEIISALEVILDELRSSHQAN
jgi:ParB family chromosome partitioning protein